MRDCGLLSALRRRPAQRLCLLDNRLSRRHGAERHSTGGRGWSKAAPVVVVRKVRKYPNFQETDAFSGT